MAGHFDKKAEAERKARDTPAKITLIARQKGYFDVSHRWRDGWLQRRCMDLVALGFLERKRNRREWSGFTRYVPSDKWRLRDALQERPVRPRSRSEVG